MKRRQRGRGRSTAEALAAAALLHDHYPIHYTECLLALGSGPLLSVDRARLGGLRLQQFSSVVVESPGGCRRYCGGNYLIALSGNIQRIALCGEVKRLSELSVQRAPSIDLA
jgi:hypothetical protein